MKKNVTNCSKYEKFLIGCYNVCCKTYDYATINDYEIFLSIDNGNYSPKKEVNKYITSAIKWNNEKKVSLMFVHSSWKTDLALLSISFGALFSQSIIVNSYWREVPK